MFALNTACVTEYVALSVVYLKLRYGQNQCIW